MKRICPINIKEGNKFNLWSHMTLAVFAAFAVVTVLVTIQTSLVGSKLAKLEKEEDQLAKQNGEILSQLARRSSVTQIASDAENLGFGKPGNIVYLNNQETIAKLP